ncbi:MAG: hypothetical protein IAE90_01070, partial [Ignavibacteria bacterium]|nr:hypothetical protein [Ignavibacteria bacterium]
EISGTHPIEKFHEIKSEIDRVIEQNNIDRILVDMRGFKGRFGVFDGLQEVESFDQNSRFLQFAILDLEENKSNNDFFENASINRGFKLVFFYNMKDALEWLQVGKHDEFEKKLQKEAN